MSQVHFGNTITGKFMSNLMDQILTGFLKDILFCLSKFHHLPSGLKGM